MTTSSFQRQFSRFYAQELKKSFASTSGDSFLLFFGRTVPWGSTFAGPPTTGNDNSPPSNSNSIAERFGAWRNAIGGKLLEPRDVYHVFPRNDWVHGTAYDIYDDAEDIFDEAYKFYVLTEEMNVYKCISNNSGSISTVKPTGTSTSIFTTDDGYKWKFIFKVTEDSKKFLNLEYVPCQFVTRREENESLPQYNVQVTATDGAIDHVGITGALGAIWPQTTLASDLSCSVRGPNTDDLHNLDDLLYGGDATATEEDFNSKGKRWITVNWPGSADLNNLPRWDHNNGYSIFFHAGVGPEVGQLRTVVRSHISTNGAMLELSHPLGATLETADPPTRYVINPRAVVNGDGEDAQIRLVSDENGEITDVKVVDSGSNYRNADISILTSGIGTYPTLRPFISPVGGHGANPIVDFNAAKIMVVMKMDGEEGGDFLIGDDFRQFGLVKNPIISDGEASGDGAYTGSVAGTEFSKTKYYTIVPSHTNNTPFNYEQEETSVVTFKEGDFVYGHESKATARIKSWKKKVGSGIVGPTGILEVDRISGEFNIPTGAHHDVRYVFNADPIVGNENNIVTGHPVRQYGATAGVPEDSEPTAKGIVKAYNREDNELVVTLRTGSFGNTGPIYVNRSEGELEVKFDDETISLLEVAGGEILKSFTIDPAGMVSFRMYPSDGTTQDAARAKTSTDIISLYDRVPTYNLTHRFIIRDDATSLEIGTFYAGQNLRQHKLNGTIASGTVSKWTMTNGTTGEMVVSNVMNSFEDTPNNGNGGFQLVGGSTAEGMSIINIQIPELVVGSGEVLYIQNIRPITRAFEQQEEFKILLGF